MGICCAYGCFNRTDKKRKEGVSFHRFPKDQTLKERWIKAVRRENWKPGPNSYVCSEHFEIAFLNRTFASGHTELREGAVPTIFPSYPLHLQPQNKKIRKPPRLRATTSVPEPSISESEEAMEVSEPPTKEVALQVDIGSSNATKLTTSNKHLQWKVKDLVRRLNHKSLVIKKMRKKETRLNVRISSMKSLMEKLRGKNLIDSECAMHIENMPDVHKDLFLSNPKKKRFSANLKAFALTLDFYSPKAYRFIRETFNSSLPHPRTLARWYSTIDGSPGFSNEALNALKQKSEEGTPIIVHSLLTKWRSERK